MCSIKKKSKRGQTKSIYSYTDYQCLDKPLSQKCRFLPQDGSVWSHFHFLSCQMLFELFSLSLPYHIVYQTSVHWVWLVWIYKGVWEYNGKEQQVLWSRAALGFSAWAPLCLSSVFVIYKSIQYWIFMSVCVNISMSLSVFVFSTSSPEIGPVSVVRWDWFTMLAAFTYVQVYTVTGMQGNMSARMYSAWLQVLYSVSTHLFLLLFLFSFLFDSSINLHCETCICITKGEFTFPLQDKPNEVKIEDIKYRYYAEL